MAEPTKAFPSASSSGSFKHDVFISYNQEDTGNNITGFLYKALTDRGINAYIDSKDLWLGDAMGPALRSAIGGSKTWIPVFSNGYLESKWCLWEFAQIVECHRLSRHGPLIVPIFYYIDPSHVRYVSQHFEGLITKHEGEFGAEVVEDWKKALYLVGDFKGEVINDAKDQATLIDLVTERVHKNLNESNPLAECDPIGIRSPIDHMLYLLQIGLDDSRFVGICGFGGIGKTTIVRALYNDIFSNFKRRSFLLDIREQEKRIGLASLQKQLLKDIFQTEFHIGDYYKGKFFIKQKCCKENVLVVLDDVDSKEQIDALVGNVSWFGEGSRVIITTRDEHILNVAKVDKDKIYRPQVLNQVQSLQLFSRHAFCKDQPPEDYKQLSCNVAHYSEGLPLTLEVLGSYLSDIRDKEVWESTLEKLKEIPNDKVQKSLKISYDNLKDDYEKAIFLDAACFFDGWLKETVISIWEACGYYPKSAIHSLIKRSLLSFDKDSCLRMHGQIRDMGREIVREKSPLDLGQRCRLWSRRDFLDVLKEHKGTGKINGMSVPFAFWTDNLASESFRMMVNLKFLNICSANFMGDFSLLPPTLRCFTWSLCTWKILPTNFYHHRIGYLDLSCSKIEQAWNGRPRDEDKVFKELKVLDLSECENLSKSPDFSWFPYLEQLDLGFCSSLKMLDESIGYLSQLKLLILISCTSLEKLPDNLGLLEKLEVLNAMECFELMELPRSMGKMKCLHSINLNGTNIAEFPDDFSMLSNLVKLDIASKRLQSLPADMSSLKNLKQLSLFHCLKLKELPELPSSLVELSCQDCYSLVRLPDLSMLKKLKTIKLEGCIEIKEIQGLEGIESLEELSACECYNLTHTPRKILGQGKLLSDSSPEDCYYLTIADGIYHKRLILCLVFEFPDFPNFFVETCQTIDIIILVSIRQKEKSTRCTHMMKIEHVKIDPFQDTIFIHHFEGFDWFGIPLQGKDAIQILERSCFPCRLKFWKLLYDDKEPEQEMPSQHTSAFMVEDFFDLSCVLNEESPSNSIDGIIDSTLVYFRNLPMLE
ncbi:hypothetical protein NE237_000650 [Protea cynaroides]|uniref:TIR domain-containing protein n=1 Tax=Protea cynaroides TaxID=273540 RepID=A0A9Q0KRZ8_9MAGN|nr:hypothetical protein NE237_000650 [Protea cynaroides]